MEKYHILLIVTVGIVSLELGISVAIMEIIAGLTANLILSFNKLT